MRARGFALPAVVVLLALIAAAALMLTREAGSGHDRSLRAAEAAAARYVAEAGLRHATWVADHSSCTGYALPATAFGVHSYSASFQPTDASPVSITVTGTTAGGAAATLMSPATKIYEPESQLVLQMGSSSGEDTMINASFPSRNYGNDNNLFVNAGSPDQRALLKFDLAGYPSGAHVVSAKLELRQWSVVTPGMAHIHRLTRSWVEGTGGGGSPDGATWNSHDGSGTWNSPGGDYTAVSAASAMVAPANSGGWAAWDVTGLVREWVSGAAPNHGLLIRGDSPLSQANFGSGDQNPGDAPKLTISYACECGRVCGAPYSGSVLLVVVNPGSLGAQEEAKKLLMESWGFTVNLIDESDPITEFETAFTSNDVVYVPQEISSGNLGTKLLDAPIGVVNEEGELVDEMGFSADKIFKSRNEIEVVDSAHYITQPFAVGFLTFASSSQSVHMLNGAMAPGRQTLAQTLNTGSQYAPSLVAFEKGAALIGGGEARGRRVQLPWGGGTFDINALNNDGRTIMRRAIEWAAVDLDPAASLVGHWKLDDATGLTALDSSGQGNDGALAGSPTWTSGYLAGALAFDPANADRVVVADAGSLDLTDAITLAAWIRPNATGTQYVIRKAQFGASDGYELSLSATGKVFFRLNQQSQGDTWRIDSVSNYPTDGSTWMHVAATFDGTTQRLYIDGVEEASQPAAITISSNDTDLSIGGQTDGTRVIDGLIDDARLYGAALDAAAIAELAAETPNTLPIAHWMLDEGAGTTAVDSVGGNDATLSGGFVWTAGTLGDAVDFDGGTGRAVTDAAFTPPPIGTVTFWIQVDGPPASRGRVLGLADHWEIRHESTGSPDVAPYTLAFDLGQAGSNTAFHTISTIDTPGRWYHIAAAYDTTTEAYAVYVDGALETSGTYPDDLAVPAPGTLSIGTRTGSSENFDGILDDIRVYDTMLSASEVAALAAAGGGGGGSPPAGVTLESYSDASLASDATTLTVATPVGTGDGDLLIAAVVTDAEQKFDMSAPAGWTLIDHGVQSKQVSMDVWWKLAGAAEPGSHDFGWDKSQQAYGFILRFSGHDPADPIDASASSGGSSNAPLSPSVTTTVANAAILRIGGFDDDDISVGDPGLSGHMAIVMDRSGTGTESASGGAGYLLQAAPGGSGTATFTLTAVEEYRTVTVAIKPL